MLCCLKGRKKSKSRIHHTDDQGEKDVTVSPANSHVSSYSRTYSNIADQCINKSRQNGNLLKENNDDLDLVENVEASNTRLISTFPNKCEPRVLSDHSELSGTNSFSTDIQKDDIDLCIVVKSAMHSHFCYLGFDQIRNRLFRPIYKTTEQECFWEINMEVDFFFHFKALQFPDDKKPPSTMLPHCKDDLLVKKTVEKTAKHIDAKLLYNKLDLIAKNSVQEIFAGIIKKSYVNEMENCHSVGILRSHGASIKCIQLKKGRIRVQIGSKQYPYTGLDINNQKTCPLINPESPALIILGLSRPWEGHHSEFTPKRCTLLVLRILQAP